MSARLPRATALLVLVASLLIASSPSGVTKTAARGIDVSRWQSTIDWARVADSGVRFAIAKATEGQKYVDPMFSQNETGATANGVVLGMYHVATPKLAGGKADVLDARAEADHFLAVASPTFSNLIPALDIEISHVPGAMDPGDLVDWTKAWVIRVTTRLGVHPMIYGSLYLFETLMGNSPWFASHGYPLWLARWGPLPSTLPAGDWQGHGWTFWQWSNDAPAANLPNIPGITTAVDRDRFARKNLVTAQISRLTVHTGAGGSVSDGTKRLACADGATCAALYDPSAMVTLTAEPHPGAVFLKWGGVCAAAVSAPTCVATVIGSKSATATFGYPLTASTHGPGAGTVTSSPAGVSCTSSCTKAFPAGSTVSLTATPDAASEFDSWSGACAGLDPSSCSVLLNRPRTVTATFADLGPPSVAITTPTSLAGSVGFAFDEPVHAIDAGDLILKVAGGSNVAASRICRDGAGARVSCKLGPVLSASVRPSAPLIAGQSYVAIANPNGAPSAIVDRAANPLPRTSAGFRSATDVSESAPGIDFRWGIRPDEHAIGGSYLYERRVGASASFSFSGPKVTLWTLAGPAFGRTRIEIDGAFRTRVDGHRRSFASIPRTFARLGHGKHTISAITLDAVKPGHPTGTGVDAIADANGMRRSPAMSRAAWGRVIAPGAGGGGYVASGVGEAQTTLRFRGTTITLRSVTGPAFGKAQIWLDGSLVRRLDLSAATTTYGVTRTVGGLSDRVHTVRVVVVGAPGKAGHGTAVAVDGWTVT
jgi:GH25 family lysozyme M1 (1,4-beta-N-acetylmuramidase)